MTETLRTATTNKLVYDAELGRYVRETDEQMVEAPESAPQPDPVAFFTALAPILGGGASDEQRALGASRLAAIDRDYRGIRDYIAQGEWTIPLALIGACLLDGVITQQEYEAVQLAWDAAHLGRPAAAE